jgi:hypothetical protein
MIATPDYKNCGCGLGQQSTEEISESVCHLHFFADRPSSVDCTLFGHLVQFVYLPMPIPQNSFLLTELGSCCRSGAYLLDRLAGNVRRQIFGREQQALGQILRFIV